MVHAYLLAVHFISCYPAVSGNNAAGYALIYLAVFYMDSDNTGIYNMVPGSYFHRNEPNKILTIYFKFS